MKYLLCFLCLVCFKAFSIEHSSATCPILTKKELCQIAGNHPHATLETDPSSLELTKKVCMVDYKGTFSGRPKGFTCECTYSIPWEWSFYLPKSITTLSITARHKNTTFFSCPIMTYRMFFSLVRKYLYQDKNDVLWRVRKNHFSSTPKEKNSISFRQKKNMKLKAKSKKVRHFCVYHVNGLPLILHNKVIEKK